MVEKIEEEPTYPLLSLFLCGKTQPVAWDDITENLAHGHHDQLADGHTDNRVLLTQHLSQLL
jgi:hypothetical protein